MLRPRPARGAPFLALGAALGAAGCGAPVLPAATGTFTEVVIVADLGDGVDSLRAALASPVRYLGRDEPRLHPVLVPPAQLRAVRGQKNLLLVARLDAPGALGRSVRALLAAADRSRIDTQGAARHLFADVYARGQVVGVLAAHSPAALDSLLRCSGPVLADAIEQSSIQRQALELERIATHPPQLAAQHGFAIAVPGTYRLVESHPDAVELVRDDPTRVVTVFWVWGVDSLQAQSPGFLLNVQSNFMRQLHGDLLLHAEPPVAAPVGPRLSLVLRGEWQNAPEVGGGPFVAHFVYDRRHRRLYGIQGLLFAPDRPKHPFVCELEALIQTFRLEAPP